jgi:anti-anti-sigma regulatory factor
MRSEVLEVRTTDDGNVVVCPHGAMDPDGSGELRHILVHTMRRVRPPRLILDLGDVPALDPINLGAVVAACELGDDHAVAVFVQNPSPTLAAQLTAWGVPRQRVRSVS